MARISGPLLGRIDIYMEVPAVKYKEITSEIKGETSTEIRERVIRARKIHYDRFANLKNVFNNGDITQRK